MKIESTAQFEQFAQGVRESLVRRKINIRVCCGPGCLPNGAQAVFEAFQKEIKSQNLEVELGVWTKHTGCQGLCEKGPLVSIEPAGVLYTRVKAHHVNAILERTVRNAEIIEELVYHDPYSRISIPLTKDILFYKLQKRIATRNLGHVDPASIEDAIAHGAYEPVLKALCSMKPEHILEQISLSGLRGRGGAGFHTARKWLACADTKSMRKFVLCNGDEGDPGAFKDRALMEGDPHSILEGMIIGAYAIGAHEGYVYVRHEYPLAVTHMQKAIDDATAMGLLGENILGSGFSFTLRLSRGAGAFVCGESSALMRSIEGKVGEPRQKYIHATEKGLYDYPTVLNNVETWANIGFIIANGADTFSSVGTQRSKGTKTFSLAGKLKNTGLIELPMGTPLRSIIHEVGGGMAGKRLFKAVQTGGPSGGCVPEALLDLPVDYEKLTQAGSMMGSGGMIVMDDRACMVDVARYFLLFLTEESCGKCLPCREGLKQLVRIYDRLIQGNGRADDIERIETIARAMQLSSLCELGKSAPNPVLSTLKYFKSEYEAHINAHTCPAGVCSSITAFDIVHDACDGCHACVKVCPTEAIYGERKQTHQLDAAKCISCGACFDICPIDAIVHFPKTQRESKHAHADH